MSSPSDLMPTKFHLRFFAILTVVGFCFSACGKEDINELEENSGAWLQKLEFKKEFKVKQIYKLGDGIENSFQGHAGQGVAIRDRIMYRLYNTGVCQTYDLTDLSVPVKLGSFGLGSERSSNHSNCAQFYMDEDDGPLLYVSGLKNGKTFVERVSTTESVLVQTITLSRLDILDNTIALNTVCGDDGNLWMFGSGGNKLFFVKARRPLLSEGDVTLGEDDILDYWFEDGYVYDDDVWQGGKVYNGLLYFLFGLTGSKAHLRIYDTRAHKQVLDIILSDGINNEPEDCEILPEGIVVVTNGGSNYYLVKPE